MNQKLYKQNVLAVIYNNEWKVCIGKYNSEFPSWMFPKWWVKKWETLEQALWREIYEELWINKNQMCIIPWFQKEFIKEYTDEERQWKIEKKWEYDYWKQENIYLVHFFGESWSIACNDEEFSEVMWVEICDLWIYITNKELLKCIDWDELFKIISTEVKKRFHSNVKPIFD
jgi:putative (di)nucleoside polyphosphate hydrolase